MSIYSDNEDTGMDLHEDADGQNTMAVLNTLGGGEDALAEGEPLGLDPEAGRAKISGSSLAVGVVVVLGAVALFGMRMTLNAIASSDDPTSAISEIEVFMAEIAAANKVGAQGPIKEPTDESRKVLDALKIDPTDHQIPAEEVESNPFDLSKIVTGPAPDPDTNPKPDEEKVARERAKAVAAKLKVDAISGNMAFINGDRYRVGDTIGSSGFKLVAIEGLTCKIKTTDKYGFDEVLEYK